MADTDLVQDTRASADDWPPAPLLTLTVVSCSACNEDALNVITVSIETDEGQHPIGGWALCVVCRATPHPTMEADRG
ncbi:hypothetical protein [Streptomyces cyaneofuscatus]|uniref:hypothetical protein n=1 Tax=Streptomyces cyaneofuscatus TaxID=66883 RepID=UPI0036D9AE1D